jgi:hypothetical protein
MGKRPDNGQDATQELTMDQLVPPARKPPAPEPTMPLSLDQIVKSPPKPPAQKVSKNDASVWRGLVVGADDFAPAAKQKSRAPRWIILGVIGAAVAVAIGVFAATRSSDEKPSAPAASAGSANVETQKPVAAQKAEVATPAAAIGSSATGSAATPPETKPAEEIKPAIATAETVDAISSAAPPTTKTATKKVATKPAAPATKKAPVTKKKLAPGKRSK